MRRPNRLAAVVPITFMLMALSSTLRGQTRPDADEIARVVEAVERLDVLRSTLAGTLREAGETPDKETFQRVCQPVGAEARRMASVNGWEVRQIAEKYRNPAHRPDDQARSIIRRMSEDEDLLALWRRSELDGQEGVRYFRRIVVEPACLACHGARDQRPEFVKEDYPEDRAYGFEIGDLRGVYAVFVPHGD